MFRSLSPSRSASLVAPIVAALLALALAAPAGAVAVELADPGDVQRRAVDTSFGIQTDPHIDGDLISYTNEEPSSEIRQFDLATGSNTAVAKSLGDFDFLSDTNAGRTTFTRVSSGRSAIMLTRPDGAVELDPRAGSRRRGSALGGGTVAWQDFGLATTSGAAEVAAHDLASGASTRLTHDELLDRLVTVSPDGDTIAWLKCDPVSGNDCDVWTARREAGGWSTSRLTGAEGDEHLPDTDGTTVVYDSTRDGERDVYSQSVGGGAERRLELPGAQVNPNISRGVVSLETYDESGASPNWDLAAWSLASGAAYRLTSSSNDETLNDISVGADGRVRVPHGTADDIELVSFDLDSDDDGVQDVSDNCPTDANPDQRDIDGDGQGDVCDSDRDGDGKANTEDNCASVANPGQENQDGDGEGDVCDSDLDGDGKANTEDNCASVANPGQENQDGDELGDACDADRPPAQQLADLIQTVEGLSLHGGTKTSLSKKLQAALAAYNSGDKDSACAKLDSFIHEVRAQSGKKVSQADADALIADAERIRTAIGC